MASHSIHGCAAFCSASGELLYRFDRQTPTQGVAAHTAAKSKQSNRLRSNPISLLNVTRNTAYMEQ